jgi:hypothetical protein
VVVAGGGDGNGVGAEGFFPLSRSFLSLFMVFFVSLLLLVFFFISYSFFDLLFSSLNQSNLFSQLNLHFFSFFFSSHLSSLFFLFFCFFSLASSTFFSFFWLNRALFLAQTLFFFSLYLSTSFLSILAPLVSFFPYL